MISGEVISTPSGLLNLDAAHIVPVESGGSDDPRNGLLMSKDLHWAFDRGLFSVSEDYGVIVSEFARDAFAQQPLKRIEGSRIEVSEFELRPHHAALAWHRENRFIG